jgi:hypothetical protein
VLSVLPGQGDLPALTVDDGVTSDVVRLYAKFAKDTGVRLTSANLPAQPIAVAARQKTRTKRHFYVRAVLNRATMKCGDSPGGRVERPPRKV